MKIFMSAWICLGLATDDWHENWYYVNQVQGKTFSI